MLRRTALLFIVPTRASTISHGKSSFHAVWDPEDPALLLPAGMLRVAIEVDVRSTDWSTPNPS